MQTPYGDSGKTTFFVRGERDWNADAGEMVDQELKVMRRIEPEAVAVEACITRHGTVVGPLMTDLTGHPELTPYRGGWCGNDIFPGALSPANRERALDFTRRLGDRLAQEGYRGQLEVDYLVDARTDELYLGELNPRLSGISSMTNVSASAYADMPLFLFHLAEYLDVDYELDVEDLRRRWGSDHLTDVWGQIILKEPDDGIELLTDAPRTGIWRMDDAGHDDLQPAGGRLARPRRRVRGLLPTDRRAWRLSLPGSRPRNPDHAHPARDPRRPADRPLPGMDRRDPVPVRRRVDRAVRGAADPGCARFQDGLRVGVEREEILAAVAAEQPAIERLLIDLVQAPTMLGGERAGQEIMRAAFEDLGLEPREIALDPDALRSHVGSSPFSWDVAGKVNVVADWPPPATRRAGPPTRASPPPAGR